ncbi:MAG: hypothetical protein JRN06_02560 [Nitrososphaerota archaeon]|nr:hypothetical protein [Nitrososphaerota archaeon]MDG7023261.1 hypothetical protein [Nitrososphaerota archaeon]
MTHESKDQRALDHFLAELGPSAAVDRFLRGYGNVRTRCSYAGHLVLYLRWLKSNGVETTPDALVQDNLKAVFESPPTDVTAKRKHTDFLGEYFNKHLIERDAGDSTRKVAAAAVRGFYESNDSELFGHWRVADQPPVAPPPPLCVEDIRKVLQAIPVRPRTPLLVSWQSSIEINRVLGMDWSFALHKEAPVKVELQGRKSHRKGYATFLGAESIQHLRLSSVMPEYTTVRLHLREAARKLGTAGLLKNPDLRSWHPHALRHSFSTECKHAKVDNEMREYFEGHVSGVKFVYQHPELHEEDFVKEYRKVEPFVSINPDRAAIEGEFAEREKSLLSRVERAESLLAELRKELGVPQTAPPQSQRSEP